MHIKLILDKSILIIPLEIVALGVPNPTLEELVFELNLNIPVIGMAYASFLFEVCLALVVDFY